MKIGRALVAGAVVVGLLVSVQLAFTAVGAPIGERWSEPVELTAISADDESGIAALATAGTDDGGVAAWIERVGADWQVKSADFVASDGEVTVERVRTIHRSDERLEDVTVGTSDDRVAIAWKVRGQSDVVLYRSGPDGDRTAVVSGDAPRIDEPSVAVTDGGVVVGWAAYADGEYHVRAAVVSEAGVDRTWVGNSTGGRGSPSVSAADDRVAITWLNASTSTTSVVQGRDTPDGTLRTKPVTTLGSARPRGGFGGSSTGGTLSSDRNTTVVRAAWTDVSRITTGAVTDDGAVVEPRVLGSGRRPAIAVGPDGWLVGWLVDSTGQGLDVEYGYLANGELERGPLSRLPSSAGRPKPVFAPDPAFVWTESGNDVRVLASVHGANHSDFVSRLATSPLRFVFVGLAALIVGLVTLPLMPWAVLPVVVVFVLTSRFVSNRLWSVLSNVGTDALADLPPLAWTAIFVGFDLTLLAYLLETGATPQVASFPAPVATSLVAFAATVAVVTVADGRFADSPWWATATFLFLQNAALWATVLPTYL